MARGGGGDITGNGSGQGFTSPSTCTHVQDAYGAPTAAVGGVPRTVVGATTFVLNAPIRYCGLRMHLWILLAGRAQKFCAGAFQRYRWGLTDVHVQQAISMAVSWYLNPHTLNAEKATA